MTNEWDRFLEDRGRWKLVAGTPPLHTPPPHPFTSRVWMPSKYLYGKKCMGSVDKEMQIKTTMKYHLTRVRMAIIKKPTNNKFWRKCKEKENLPMLIIGT